MKQCHTGQQAGGPRLQYVPVAALENRSGEAQYLQGGMSYIDATENHLYESAICTVSKLAKESTALGLRLPRHYAGTIKSPAVRSEAVKAA